MNNLRRFILYVLGMIILALGLSLSTKLKLGVSALMTLPFMISSSYNLNFGDITLIYYIGIILVEILIHIKNKKYQMIVNDMLQFVLSIFFTRVLNIFGNVLPNFNNEIYMRILIYFVSILLVGIGASIVIDTKLVPNPADGLVATLSETLKKNMGNMKNICDITVVIITILISLIINKKILGIGIGTILSMLFIGRVIYFFNKKYEKKIKKICGVK